MKKHLSVLMLHSRRSLYKALIIMLVMALVEGIMLFLAAQNTVNWDIPASIEAVVEKSHVIWVFAAAFLALAVVLSLSGCEFGSKQGYTLRRLQVSEKAVFLWQWIYNSLCFVLLLAVQAAVVFLFCRWFESVHSEAVNHQSVFLAFYRSEIMQSILPIENWPRWIRNGLMILAVGAAAAHFPLKQRRGKWGVWIIMLAVLSIFNFVSEIEMAKDMVYTGLMFLALIVILFSGLYLIIDADGEEDEADETP